MKKVFLIIMVFFMTGCFKEVGQGIITKECYKHESINDTNITIKSKEGSLSLIKIVETYNTSNLTSILNSKRSEANMYQSESGINITIDDNVVSYDIDILNASQLVLERFNINTETHKMLKFYEDNGFTCK